MSFWPVARISIAVTKSTMTKIKLYTKDININNISVEIFTNYYIRK